MHPWPGQKCVPLGHVQMPLTQAIPVSQAFPHAPQFDVLVRVFTSHPLTKLPSQFLVTHTPLWQVAPIASQLAPQTPQLRESIRRLISQPSAMTPLQFAKPGVHVPVHVSVVPFGVQVPVKFGAEHASPALLPTQA